MVNLCFPRLSEADPPACFAEGDVSFEEGSAGSSVGRAGLPGAGD